MPFSRLERKAVRSQMLGLTLRFGLAPWFWSISPDDMHNPTSIRLCFSSSSNHDFPAAVDNAFFAALRKNEPYQGTALDETSLQRMGVLNPIATALGFHHMIETVFTVLVGLEPKGKNRKTKPVYAYDHVKKEYTGRMGVVGACIAWKYIIENSGKLSMHIHGGGVGRHLRSAAECCG